MAERRSSISDYIIKKNFISETFPEKNKVLKMNERIGNSNSKLNSPSSNNSQTESETSETASVEENTLRTSASQK